MEFNELLITMVYGKKFLLQIGCTATAEHENIFGTAKCALVTVIHQAAIEFPIAVVFRANRCSVLLQVNEFVSQFELQWSEIRLSNRLRTENTRDRERMD